MEISPNIRKKLDAMQRQRRETRQVRERLDRIGGRPREPTLERAHPGGNAIFGQVSRA